MCRRLAQARSAAKLSQAEAAKLIGAGEPQYQKWELRSPPPAYYLPRICETLRIDCWWLLTGRMVQDHMSPDGSPRTERRPFRAA
jgi:transcriptional regulator with XRE-family HTH domain